MKRIVFLGNKTIGDRCLYYLRQQKVEIAAVVCCSGTGISVLAGDLKIPIINVEEITALVNIDLLISVSYWKRIPLHVLNHAHQGGVNLHLALLPYYRGCNAYSHAILNGEKEYGVTLHEMVEKFDAGPIIATAKFEIRDNATAYDLHLRSVDVAYDMFRDRIMDVIEERYAAISHWAAHLLAPGNMHYYPRNSLDKIRELDLSMPVEEALRFIRALDFPSFEPAYMFVNGEKVHLTTRWNKR